ncbi:MAG: hypothetical protein HY719_16220, partial [Planctomycetes bacterium]|nr:hypothetical protein [Planctomycetota bacterium]
MPAVIAVIDAEGPERDARPVAYAPGSCSRPARLAQPLRGAPRIARVVAGLSRCAHLAGVAVVATEETLAVLAPLLAGLCWRPVPLNTGPAAPLPSPDLRRLRRFAARAWRVGPAGAFAFEEEARPEAVVAAIAAFAPTAHAALIVPPLAMLVDPALADRMAAAFLSRQPEGGILLCGAPPGFDYAVLSASAAREGAARGAFPTAGLCLDLSGGAPDIELTDAYFPLPQRVVACRGRFLLDSVRGEEAAERFLDFAGARPDLAPIDAAAAFMEAEPLAFRGRLPRLVTVEVCSAVEIVPLWHPA